MTARTTSRIWSAACGARSRRSAEPFAWTKNHPLHLRSLPAATGSAIMPLMLLPAAITLLSVLSFGKDAPRTGKTAFTDYTQEKPGVVRKITPDDLPAPFASESQDNGPTMVP